MAKDHQNVQVVLDVKEGGEQMGRSKRTEAADAREGEWST